MIEPTEMTKINGHLIFMATITVLTLQKIQPCDLNYDSSIQHGVSRPRTKLSKAK